MDWVKDIVAVILGALFSGALLTSLLFYRQIKKQHQANADKAKAEVDGVKVTTLGQAIELLRGENERLSTRLDLMQERIDVLQTRIDVVCEENASLRSKVTLLETENIVLKGKLTRLRRALLELRKGLSMMVAQVCEARLEPAYQIPEHILEWTEEDEGEDNG